MRTSGPQFEMMVTYMEQHGDLNKPTGHARGRIEAINRWEELTTLLNSDISGEKKDTEKWKKSYIAPPASPTPTQTAPVPSTSGQVILSSQHPQTPQNTPRRHRHSTPRNSPRRRHAALHNSPRRRTRPMTITDRVAYEFQQSDTEWRKYLMDKEKREAENQAEQLRLRAIELRLQEQWQEIVKRALEILEEKLK